MHFTMMALMFSAQRPMILLLGPYGIFAACGLDEFAAKRFAQHPLYATLQGPRVHALLSRNQVRAAPRGRGLGRQRQVLDAAQRERCAS
jgi:hypothetical protein